MTEKRYKSIGANLECPNGMEYMLIKRNDGFNVCQVCSKHTAKEIVDELNSLAEENEELKDRIDNYNTAFKKLQDLTERKINENEQLKIRNKGKQAFIDKQDKIIRLLYNQCKDFKEILDDSNITYPIDERLNKFFEEGVKL